MVEDILRSILPDTIEAPSSFTTIGHIAHLNLKEEHAPYKHIIGQVILDVRVIFNSEMQTDQNSREQNRYDRSHLSLFLNGNPCW